MEAFENVGDTVNAENCQKEIDNATADDAANAHLEQAELHAANTSNYLAYADLLRAALLCCEGRF